MDVSNAGLTILVVEDEDGLRDMVAEALAAAGYRVVPAADGTHALVAAAFLTGPLLLLTDVSMPGMSGREVAERLRAARPGVPVLFMSGYVDDDALRCSVLRNEVALLDKPFSFATLLEKVREVLGSAAKSAC